MFVKKNASYLKVVKIDISEPLGCNEGEAYISLRELDTKETLNLRKNYEEGTEALLVFFHELLPAIIVNHNLYEDENTPMKNEAIADLVYSKMELTNLVIEKFCAEAFSPIKR